MLAGEASAFAAGCEQRIGSFRKLGGTFKGIHKGSFKRIYTGSIKGLGLGSFRKLGVPYLGVLIVRILLLRMLYSGPLFSETPKCADLRPLNPKNSKPQTLNPENSKANSNPSISTQTPKPSRRSNPDKTVMKPSQNTNPNPQVPLQKSLGGTAQGTQKPYRTVDGLGRALGHFIFSVIGLRRILFTHIFQKL